MAHTAKSTRFPSATFDLYWPPDSPFPPITPWIGAVVSRSEVRADLVQLFARFSRVELLRMMEANGDSQDSALPPPNNPYAIKFVVKLAVLGALWVWAKYPELDRADEKWTEEDEEKGEDGGEENGGDDENGGTDTGGGEFYDDGSDFCSSPFVMC